MLLRTLCLAGLIAVLTGCHTANPWAESFSPADFRAGWPPVPQARVINVGHVDPMEVHPRDFGDTTLVGTARWVGYRSDPRQVIEQARSVGADLVLMRRRFHGSESRTTYDPPLASRRRSVVIKEADGRRRRVTAAPGAVHGAVHGAGYGPSFLPRTRTRHRYAFTGVFLRTAEAQDAGPSDAP